MKKGKSQKTIMLIALFLVVILIGGTAMTSCRQETDESGNVSGTESTPPVTNDGNIALGSSYCYDYGFSVHGDLCLTALTDGKKDSSVEMKTNLKRSEDAEYTLDRTDWYGTAHKLTVENEVVAISVDFGFMAKVTAAKLCFEEYPDKGKIGVYASTDGYNFTDYLGEYANYNELQAEINFENLYCKALLFTIPLAYNNVLKLSEIEVYGEKDAEKQLLSLGATYEWLGAGRKAYPENTEKGKLTDGIVFTGESIDCLVGRSGGAEKDPITAKSGTTITLNLGDVKNVSEVDFGLYRETTTSLPERITVRYSENGTDWNDFGQSFLRTSNGLYDNCSYKYTVTRNHTVKAQYIKIYFYNSGLLILDEVMIYGNEKEIAEPDYGFVDKINNLSNTNVAAYKEAKLNDAVDKKLTDMDHTSAIAGKPGANTIELNFGKVYDELCAVMLNTDTTEMTDIKLYIDNGSGYTELKGDYSENSVAGGSVKYLFFDKTKAKSVKIEFNSTGSVTIREIAAYSAQPQLPVVKGGFFQLPTSGGGNTAAQNSQYSWYLQLKGMRDLGMEFVVIQYSTHYNAKTTLINGTNITAAGYKYNQTYGTTDVCKAVLDAAEKLNMKVWLGTIHDADFRNPIGNMSTYAPLVEQSYAIIKDIYEMYSGHKAFGGYYLSDETCDQWLNLHSGVEACRYVYKSQSDYIRSIDSKSSIMIAPAIWRSGEPEKGADNLYRMIAPEKDGEKPVVDIVAAQDCLGREQTLTVQDSVYKSYESYVDEWAKAVRRAGAAFWHDAEVFEIVSSGKRCEEVVKSLTIEAKTSGTIIVFDIPHYFSSYPMYSYNDPHDYYKRLIMRKYAAYYSSWSELDTIGGTQPEVITDDGKELEKEEPENLTAPIVYDKSFNDGVIVSGKPAIDSLDSVRWNNFVTANGSGSKAQFAYYRDNEAFYVLLKTNDATDSYGVGKWWEGKDDLVQIWMSGTGQKANDILTVDSGIRFYIHRTGKTAFSVGGECSEYVTFGNFNTVLKDGVYLITMPWSSLGRTAPTAGDGTAIAINIQYIDGADGSWSSSVGSNGRDITDKSLYSY